MQDLPYWIYSVIVIIQWTQSATNPIDELNINLYIDDGPDQSRDYHHENLSSYGNGAYPPQHDYEAFAPSYGNGLYPLSYGYEPYPPIPSYGNGLYPLSYGYEPYPPIQSQDTISETRIPRIKLDDVNHDTSNIRICKEQSVRECLRIIVNVNDVMSAKQIMLPNGDMITDGKTLNLYGNRDYSDYGWPEKPKSFKLPNPRLYKTSNNLEAMFSETDGVIAASVPSINNIIYSIEYCGAGCYLWLKRDTTGLFDEEAIPRRKPGWKNRYSRPGRTATSDYQDIRPLSKDADPVSVSVMVYYTREYAKAAANGPSNESPFKLQQAITELAFNKANHDLRESEVPVIFYPHCFEQSTIADSQTAKKLLDDLTYLRPSYRETRKSADIAALLVETLIGQPNGGLAWAENRNNENGTFAVVKRSYMASIGFLHELAHTFGAHHDIEKVKKSNKTRSADFPHAYGYIVRGHFGTVMSYTTLKNETLLHKFSDPNQTYKGMAIGKLTSANNNLRMREQARYISTIGDETITCPITVRVCVTTTPGHTCEFPFIYNGIVYNGCIPIENGQSWCSTRVDNSGTHMTGNWAYCLAGCPRHGED